MNNDSRKEAVYIKLKFCASALNNGKCTWLTRK